MITASAREIILASGLYSLATGATNTVGGSAPLLQQGSSTSSRSTSTAGSVSAIGSEITLLRRDQMPRLTEKANFADYGGFVKIPDKKSKGEHYIHRCVIIEPAG
jgi:hypothetical protein